ncbi:MAG: hypothetical protein U9Q77_01815 [Candidatus Marinimicrobia bacterium]|nr:hypothetical protein [Candidatus Neomarinimicrobiota bacterium]
MKNPFLILVVYILGITSLVFGQVKICRVDHPSIDEQSAIVKSRTYDNVFWVSNDSDTEPYIFPLNIEGEIIIPGYLQKYYGDQEDRIYPGMEVIEATLYDWESMAVLGDTLVIGDIGNNGNARRDLGVYLIPEPNPHASRKIRPLAWYPVRYEDQHKYPPSEWEYDCEAIYTFKGKIYFLTKHRSDQHIFKPSPATKLYRMDTRHTSKVNVLKYISRKENLGGWVTDADIAPDESALVVLAQNPLVSTIWYFPRPKRGDDFLSQTPQSVNLLKVDQAEGICFKDANTLIITNEQRDWFEVPLSAFSK